MKVLFFFHETGRHNGSWKSAHNLLIGLRNAGINLLVITPDRHELFEDLVDEGFQAKAVKIVWNNDERNNSFKYHLYRFPFNVRRMVLSAFWWVRVSKIIKKYKPDIIHTNSSVFYLSYDIAKFFNIPHVWHIREYGDKDFNIDITPTMRRFADGYSSYVCIAKDLQSSRGLSNNPASVVIYNGILNESSICFEKEKSDYFLFVGSLGLGKGIKDIIDTWREFYRTIRKDFKLVIVGGSESEIRYWKNYIGNSSTQNYNIDFIGKRDDALDIMKKARAVLMASYNEAFGRVTAEAMFCGALVIGRNTAGTREQFDNGVEISGNEIGLRFTDNKELLQCLSTVASMDEETYSTYIQRAQFTVKRLYTNEVYVSSIVNIYRSLLASNR